MTTIEVKHRYTGDILFAHECKDNTITATLFNAGLSGACLICADLSDANLSHADLRDVIN